MSWVPVWVNSLIAHFRWNLWRFNVRKLWTDLSSIEVDRPIFLLGTQGAGLTLLSRMLQRNPQVVNVWGDARHWAGSDELHVVLAPRLPDSLRLRGHPELRARRLGESWTYATDEMLPYFRKTGTDASEALRSRFLDVIRELLLLHAGRGRGFRFLDKSQSYTVKVAFLERLLRGTHPHYVLVTRNPYAMCRRATLKGGGRAEARHGKLELVRLAAQHWNNSYQYALEDGRDLGRMQVLRFEDLLKNPGARVRAICDFLDLRYYAGMLPAPEQSRPLGSSRDHKWYPLRSDVNHRYLETLDLAEIELIRERCGDLAERFGYTPEGP